MATLQTLKADLPAHKIQNMLSQATRKVIYREMTARKAVATYRQVAFHDAIWKP
jgi:hypothetical protein